MPLPLYLLAVAVFAMGTSEFMLAGLAPDIAIDLDVSVGVAGLLTSAFAVGMVIGAPLMAALARRWPARVSLLGFVLVFTVAHVVGALTTSFSVLLITRVIARPAWASCGSRSCWCSSVLGPSLVSPSRDGSRTSVPES